MPTSDLQLQSLGLKPMSDLPNRDGFAFTGMTRVGGLVSCHVTKCGTTGLHSVVGALFNDLIGWK